MDAEKLLNYSPEPLRGATMLMNACRCDRRPLSCFGTAFLAIALLAGGVWPPSTAKAAEPAEQYYMYVGTYTRGGKSEGIYIYRFDAKSGKVTPIGAQGGVDNPSFLAPHPSGKFLYSVGEVGEFRGKQGGAVAAFSVDSATGKLEFLNAQSSGGAGPCHLNVDKTGQNVVVANYGGGSAAVLPIKADGRVAAASSFVQHEGSSILPSRQKGPHAHSINLDAANRYAMVADLGLDQVLVYRFNPSVGELVPNDPPFAKVAPGAGPRHFAFHPSGKFSYVINEINSTITAFTYDGSAGKLTELQTITTLPEGFKGNNSTAEVVAHPSGKFLYGSNRGHDSIAVFGIDQATGKLTAIEHEPTQGETPRNFFVDPTGKFLLAENQKTDSIAILAIDQESGELNPTGQKLAVPSPVCIRMIPIGN